MAPKSHKGSLTLREHKDLFPRIGSYYIFKNALNNNCVNFCLKNSSIFTQGEG